MGCAYIERLRYGLYEGGHRKLVQNSVKRSGCRGGGQKGCRGTHGCPCHGYRNGVSSWHRGEIARIQQHCSAPEALVTDPKQKGPYRSHEVGKPAKPYTGDQSSPQPDEKIPKQVPGHVVDEDVERQMLWHVGRIEFGESKGCLAQLAVFLLRMRQPLHQTVLVDIFYTPTTFAREEQRLVVGGFAPANPTGIEIDGGIIGPRVAGRYHVALDVGSSGGMSLGVMGIIDRRPVSGGTVIHRLWRTGGPKSDGDSRYRLITGIDWCEGSPRGYSVDIATMRSRDCPVARAAHTHTNEGAKRRWTVVYTRRPPRRRRV